MHYNIDAIRRQMVAVKIRTMDIEKIPELRNRIVYRLEQGHDVEFQRILLLAGVIVMSPNEILGYKPIIANTIARRLCLSISGWQSGA